MKKLLLIFVVGMLFIGCDDTTGSGSDYQGDSTETEVTLTYENVVGQWYVESYTSEYLVYKANILVEGERGGIVKDIDNETSYDHNTNFIINNNTELILDSDTSYYDLDAMYVWNISDETIDMVETFYQTQSIGSKTTYSYTIDGNVLTAIESTDRSLTITRLTESTMEIKEEAYVDYSNGNEEVYDYNPNSNHYVHTIDTRILKKIN